MANHKKIKNKKSRSERETDRQKRNNRTVAIVMAVLMIASLAGIALGGFNQQPNNSAFTYGDYKFELQNIEGTTQSMLVTEINNKEVGFYSLPQDVLNLDVQGNLSFLQNTTYMMFTGNPEDRFMQIQDILRFEIEQATGKNIGGAVMIPHENYSQYPLVTCLNSSITVPVIEIVESNATSVVVADNYCVHVESRPEDILYVRDLLLYNALGVI